MYIPPSYVSHVFCRESPAKRYWLLPGMVMQWFTCAEGKQTELTVVCQTTVCSDQFNVQVKRWSCPGVRWMSVLANKAVGGGALAVPNGNYMLLHFLSKQTSPPSVNRTSMWYCVLYACSKFSQQPAVGCVFFQHKAEYLIQVQLKYPWVEREIKQTQEQMNGTTHFVVLRVTPETLITICVSCQYMYMSLHVSVCL